ncbi:MAG: hypothetical protein R3B96_22335 [Pirellulaceae bacterium]
MIVVMEKDATPEQIQHMTQRVEELGLKAHVIRGTERTVIAAVGAERGTMQESPASGPGGRRHANQAPYKVASRELKPEPTGDQGGQLHLWSRHGWRTASCSVEMRSKSLLRLEW